MVGVRYEGVPVVRVGVHVEAMADQGEFPLAEEGVEPLESILKKLRVDPCIAGGELGQSASRDGGGCCTLESADFGEAGGSED